MCQHQPPCPPAGAPDRQGGPRRGVYPEQGWSLLCNGVVAFEDTGVRAVRSRDVCGHQSQCLLGTAD